MGVVCRDGGDSEADVQSRFDLGHLLFERVDALADIQSLFDVGEALGDHGGKALNVFFYFLLDSRRVRGQLFVEIFFREFHVSSVPVRCGVSIVDSLRPDANGIQDARRWLE